jgi:general stress protein YciG
MNDESKVQARAGQEQTKRGFAAWDRAMVQEVARRGGVAAHRLGTAHRFSSEEARIAGRKGGLARHPRRAGNGNAD